MICTRSTIYYVTDSEHWIVIKKTNRDKNKDKAENQGSSILSSIEEDDNKGSKVWNHFDKFVDDRGVLWAKCRYCGYEK